MPARILTLGDLQAALAEAPYNTTISVSLGSEVVAGVVLGRHVSGTMTSVVPAPEGPKLVDTMGEAANVEDLVNGLVAYHAGNLIAMLGTEYEGRVHYSRFGSTAWWTDCRGCERCRPYDKDRTQ